MYMGTGAATRLATAIDREYRLRFHGRRKPLPYRRKMTHLTSEQHNEIRTLYATGHHTQSSLGKMYGVSESTVRNIIIGPYWKRRKESTP